MENKLSILQKIENINGDSNLTLSLYKLLFGLLKKKESFIFKDPVNWKELGLLDYLQIIKRPMNLLLIKKNIENGYYNLNISNINSNSNEQNNNISIQLNENSTELKEDEKNTKEEKIIPTIPPTNNYQIIQDIRQIWLNCLMYNRDGSEVRILILLLLFLIIIIFHLSYPYLIL